MNVSYAELEKEFADVCDSIELLDDLYAGWYPNVKASLENSRRYKVQISLIKEKFGNLRICCYKYVPEFSLISSYACDISAKTCCKCGRFGQLRIKEGWYVTGCEECFQEWEIDR